MKYVRWGLPVAALVAFALWMMGCSTEEHTTHSTGLQYQLNEDGSGYSVTGIGDIEDTEVTIPSEYNGKPVTDIGAYAFRGRSDITGITIPNSVTHISQWAFSDCDGLTDVTIPDSVTFLGRSLFEHCDKLARVTLPDGLTGIDMNAFRLCPSLTEITIPNSVTEIGEGAFESCSGLESISIPGSVTDIGQSAFSGTAYYNNESNWTDDVLYIDHALIDCRENRIDAVIIKDGTTCIADHAFSDCKGLTDITILNSVIGIGDYAFSGCTALKSITIPNSVTGIGISPFSGCIGLESITVAAGNTVYHAAENCLIETTGKTLIAGCKNSVIPTDGSVTAIGERAFLECTGLTSITIPGSVTGIGSSAFSGTAYYNNKSNWTDDVLYIGSVLIDCKDGTTGKDGELIIKTKTTLIADSAFSGCKGLTKITIPISVTVIGNFAFEGCTGLKSISIPDQVTHIGESAFKGCTGLKSITLPDSVTDIGHDAFFDTAYYNTGSNWTEDVLYIGSVLIECKEDKTGVVTIKDGTTRIADSAFSGCKSLTDITIPDSVTSIGANAFSDCSELKDITYKGSQEQWNKVVKKGNWNTGSAIQNIHCRDGEISL